MTTSAGTTSDLLRRAGFSDSDVSAFAEAVPAMASYDRDAQRFANIRAARDAEIRAAKTLADQIRTRLAVALQN